MKYDWDIASPLAELDDLLADVESGTFRLEDIIAEFQQSSKPSGAAAKPTPGSTPGGASEKKPDRAPEIKQAKREEEDFSRFQEAADGISRQEEPSVGLPPDEADEEDDSGAEKTAAAFSSIFSLAHRTASGGGKRLKRLIPRKNGAREAIYPGDAMEANEEPIGGEPKPKEPRPRKEPERETFREEMTREEILQVEPEPVQADETMPVDEVLDGETQNARPDTEDAEEERDASLPVDEPKKIGIFSALRQALQKADDYAENMYPEETETEEEPEEPEEFNVRAWEEGKKKSVHRRRPRRPEPPPEPERPPEEMADRYAKGLAGLRFRIYIVFFLCLALCYIVLGEKYQLPLPGEAESRFAFCLYTSLALECAVAVLGLHVIIEGLRSLSHLRIGVNTLAVFSLAASMVDGVVLLTMNYRPETQPFCAISAVSILFAMWGGYLKRRGLRMTYRAASASEPYLVTRDKKKWNTKGCFTKHPGRIDGFVTQVEQPDGAELIFARIAPLLLMASLIFAVLATVGRQRPELFLWSFSAIIASATAFSSFFTFSLPFSVLARRLMHSGAALAGWRGLNAMTGKNGIVLTDTDLFPPGAVSLNGIKVFGDFPVDKVVSSAASMMRAAECGLEKIFHELLRGQGAIYRRVEEFCFYEQGGFGAAIRGDQVLVGSAAFMRVMGVSLPAGLKVKNAVFCAIDGELAGIFAINYSPSPAVRNFLSALLRNKLSPVLATRDVNLTPAMLAQRFKLRLERLDYPPMDQRIYLSGPVQPHSKTIAALLTREGLPPFAEAVVGGRRLRRASVTSTVISVASSIIGMLLAAYLTSAEAFASISASNLLFFMLLWLVPVLLVSGRISRH